MADGSKSYTGITTYQRLLSDWDQPLENEARALRILEIMNDFRSVQQHIADHVNRASNAPPDAQSANLVGYALLRQCGAEARLLLASQFDARSLGLPSNVRAIPQTEVQKASLQRIILDASSRRFQAHKIYLRCAAATRWIMARQQITGGAKPNSRHADPLRRVDQRLREEVQQFTDTYVMNDLGNADRRKGYWQAEDPSLERILAWIRTQR